MAKRGRPTDGRSAEAQVYRAWYKTARWQMLRKHQLAIEPLCRMCKDRGVVTPATVCDHVDPEAKKKSESAFFAGPFQSLCKPCHDGEKQRVEARGYSSAVDASGWYTDPSHPANRKRAS